MFTNIEQRFLDYFSSQNYFLENLSLKILNINF